MGTKRIFIAGHGAMLNDETITETIDVTVNCYVKEGGFFSYYFTPGFIQSLVQGKDSAGFNIEDLIKKAEHHAPGDQLIYILRSGSTIKKHVLFLLNDDPYPKQAKCYKWGYEKNLCNYDEKGVMAVKLYNFIPLNESQCTCIPFKKDIIKSFDKFEFRIGNPDYRYKDKDGNVDEEHKLGENDILVLPIKIGSPSPDTITNYPSLGEIITQVKTTYPNYDYEFYWFACREFMQDNPDN